MPNVETRSRCLLLFARINIYYDRTLQSWRVDVDLG